MSSPATEFGRRTGMALLAGAVAADVSRGAQAAEPISEEDAHTIGVAAYLYPDPFTSPCLRASDWVGSPG